MDSLPINQILQGDTLELLPSLPKASVDLIFADPPYNLQLQRDLWRPNLTPVDAVDDEWDHFEDFADYDNFTRRWLTAARRVMKPTATIWISGTYHNIFRVGAILQDLDFWVLNTIAWFKPNAMPNFRGARLKNDVEFVIWAKRAEKGRYTFHHHQMKQFNDGKQLGSVWNIPVCSGPERLRDATGKKLHPTQKPEALLTRIIAASSQPGDLVLDPFLGSGTTAAVARRLRRDWIGIERESNYVAAARARIDRVEPLSADLIENTFERVPERIPFRTLIERGLLRPGQSIYLDEPDYEATVLAEGLINVNGVVGSIHQLGAKLKRTPSCNGWVHWRYFDDAGELAALDTLRTQIRAELVVG